MAKKRTIAFLSWLMTSYISREVLKGIKKGMHGRNCRVIALPGGSVETDFEKWKKDPVNLTYHLATEKRFDGIIISGGAMGQFIPKDKLISFIKGYDPLPIINISMKLPGIPSVSVSNKNGVYELVSHLIEKHRYQQIAFVCGPSGHGEAEDRLKGYKDALEDHGIEVDENIILPGDFSRDGGRLAVTSLLDKKEIIPDAMVCVDDDSAVGAIEELKHRRINIPGKVAVVGFDDSEVGRNANPSLTTAKQSFLELGENAASLLLDKIDGMNISEVNYSPSRAVIRESCGCITGLSSYFSDGNRPSTSLPPRWKPSPEYLELKELLMKSLKIGFSEKELINLLSQYDWWYQRLHTNGEHDAFDTALKYLEILQSQLMNEMLQQSREIRFLIDRLNIRTYSSSHRMLMMDRLNMREWFFNENFANQALHQVINMEELYLKILREFPLLLIHSFFLVLYDNPIEAMDARLVFAYNENGRMELPVQGVPFEKDLILPDVFLNDLTDDLVISALTYERKSMGYVIFHTRDEQIEMTHFMSWHLSSAIHKLQILEEEERKNKELEVAKAYAEKAAQIKADFLANMSHEIRTPLSGITGMLHLVMKTPLTGAQKRYLQSIDRSSQTLLHIINDILDFSKIEAGKLNLEEIGFDIFETIENVRDILNFNLQEKSLALDLVYENKVNQFHYGDPLRLSQILMNLLNNAVKFTERGVITLSIRQKKDNRLYFKLSDQGIGMTEDQISRLFQSFSQADESTTRKYGGTGLGLTISKQLVELMNGNIWAESQVGHGSVFHFEVGLNSIKLMDKPQSLEGKRILVVTPQATLMEKILDWLEHWKCHCDSTTDSYQAMTMVRAQAYDLVLIDWDEYEEEEVLNCRDLLMQLGNVRTCIYTVVAMTESTNFHKLRMEREQAGVERFIQKPINKENLQFMMESLFSNHPSRMFHTHNDTPTELEIFSQWGSQNILIVEDNLVNQEIIKGLLEDTELVLDMAENGKEALELFQPGKYALILMDIQMPEMDGYQATAEIRKQDENIPIVALTANAMVDQLEKVNKEGMNQSLTKPIDVKRFYNVLNDYLNHQDPDAIEENLIEYEEEEHHLDLQKGLASMGGKEDLFRRVLIKFLEKTKDPLDKDLSEEDRHRRFHSLKGLSGSIGANRLSKICKKLEKEDNPEWMEDFKNEWHLVVEEINNYLQK